MAASSIAGLGKTVGMAQVGFTVSGFLFANQRGPLLKKMIYLF